MKVELQNVTRIFPSRNKREKNDVVAVNNFTFEIPDGKLIGLLGPSGCGKSTTLYMISGLQRPTSGRIFFGEDDVTDLAPENRGVGLVFQNYALYPHMTVKQNILFPLQNLKGEDKMTKEDMLERAYNVARLVQIDELMERKPSELSGGQQQRVAIARALVKMPRVLLLDEPLSNLDARLRLQTREEIRRIQRETQITTVFVTHDQEEAMSISDTIVVMKLGVIQQIGKPQDVYDNPTNLFVAKFLGTPPINIFKGYVRNEMLYIGDDPIMSVPGIQLPEKKVKVEQQDNQENISTEHNTANGQAVDSQTAEYKTVEDGVKGHPVYIGIRPEGFIVDEQNGPLHCHLNNVEVMGRDMTVVSSNSDSESGIIRSIINSDSGLDRQAETVRYSLKPHKVFIFDLDTEERILFEVK
ncbi:MAG: ABC transporter ATP-binding protein [Clostridia bacterium]|nr:ABC transporter ATP-binding protein [Clostridia bacterium]